MTVELVSGEFNAMSGVFKSSSDLEITYKALLKKYPMHFAHAPFMTPMLQTLNAVSRIRCACGEVLEVSDMEVWT